MDQTAPVNCPLCLNTAISTFFSDKFRDFWRCNICSLVFVSSEQHLSLSDEKAIYDLHENNPENSGYRQFLSRLSVPLTDRLNNHAVGLDYGCGPGPALAAMLNKQGFKTDIYDPIYNNHTELLKLQYDFITCTEVVEHFRNPHAEFKHLFTLLNNNGWLGIMTKQVINAKAFASWHYKNDLTHISFFSKPTFLWLAKRYHCQIEFLYQDVVILQLQ